MARQTSVCLNGVVIVPAIDANISQIQNLERYQLDQRFDQINFHLFTN